MRLGIPALIHHAIPNAMRRTMGDSCSPHRFPLDIYGNPTTLGCRKEASGNLCAANGRRESFQALENPGERCGTGRPIIRLAGLKICGIELIKDVGLVSSALCHWLIAVSQHHGPGLAGLSLLQEGHHVQRFHTDHFIGPDYNIKDLVGHFGVICWNNDRVV